MSSEGPRRSDGGWKNVIVETIAFRDGSSYNGQALRDADTSDLYPHGFGHMVTEQGVQMVGYFRKGRAVGPGSFIVPSGDTFYGVWDAQHKRHGVGVLTRFASDGAQFLERYTNGKPGKRMRRRVDKVNSGHRWLMSSYQSQCMLSAAQLTVLSERKWLKQQSGIVQHLCVGERMLSDSLAYCNELWLRTPRSYCMPPPADGGERTVVDEVHRHYGRVKNVTFGQRKGLVGFLPAALPQHVRLGSAPPPLTGHTASVVMGGRYVVVFGGMTNEAPPTEHKGEEPPSSPSSAPSLRFSRGLYAFDVFHGVWIDVDARGTPPPAISDHCATLLHAGHWSHGSSLLVTGGSCGPLQVNSGVYLLDCTTWTWFTVLPPEGTRGVGASGLPFTEHSCSWIEPKYAGRGNGLGKLVVIVQDSVFTMQIPLLESGRGDFLPTCSMGLLKRFQAWNLGGGGGSKSDGLLFRWVKEDVDARALPIMQGRSFVGHAAVAVGPMIFVFGGKILGKVGAFVRGDGDSAPEPTTSHCRYTSLVRILHCDKYVWEVPKVTAAQEGKSDGPSPFDTSAYVFDHRLNNAMMPRAYLTASFTWDGTRIIIHGGHHARTPSIHPVNSMYNADTHVLNLETLTFTSLVAKVPAAAPPRGHHTAVILKAPVRLPQALSTLTETPTAPEMEEMWVFGGKNHSADCMWEFRSLSLDTCPGVIKTKLHLPPAAGGETKSSAPSINTSVPVTSTTATTATTQSVTSSTSPAPVPSIAPVGGATAPLGVPSVVSTVPSVTTSSSVSEVPINTSDAPIITSSAPLNTSSTVDTLNVPVEDNTTVPGKRTRRRKKWGAPTHVPNPVMKSEDE